MKHTNLLLIYLLFIASFVAPCPAKAYSEYTPDPSRFTTGGPAGHLYDWKINEDSVTVRFMRQSITRNQGYQPMHDLENPVVHPTTGKEYTITILGHGREDFSSCIEFAFRYIKPVNTIPPNIIRIEDRATYNGAEGIIDIPKGNNLKYIGKDNMFMLLTLWVNADCELHSVGCGRPYLFHLDGVEEFGDDGEVMFREYRGTHEFPSVLPMTIIEVNCQTPPTVHGVIYEDKDFYDMTKLYVPAGTVPAYIRHPEWRKFKNIYEFGATSSITDIDNLSTNCQEASINASVGGISITLQRAAHIRVTDFLGRDIRSGTLPVGVSQIAVSPGMYIVTLSTGDRAKVLVR